MPRVFGSALVMPCPATTAEMRSAPASGWTVLRGTTPKVTDCIMWNVVIGWRTIVHGRETDCCPHLMPAQVHQPRKESGGSRALGWVCSGSLWFTARKAAGETRATGGFRTTCTTCWRDQDPGLLSTTLLCKCRLYTSTVCSCDAESIAQFLKVLQLENVNLLLWRFFLTIATYEWKHPWGGILDLKAIYKSRCTFLLNAKPIDVEYRYSSNSRLCLY